MKTILRKNSKISETMFVEGIGNNVPLLQRAKYKIDLNKQLESCREYKENLFACTLSDMVYTNKPTDECVVPIYDNHGFEKGFVVITHCAWKDEI